MYIPNWIYRYLMENPPYRDPIAVVAGLIQTVLYSDFFYIYYTKYAQNPRPRSYSWKYKYLTFAPGYYKARSSTFRCKRAFPRSVRNLSCMDYESC